MPVHPILTSLNQIMGKNMEIQRGNFSQQIKDSAIRITNESLDYTVEQLAPRKIYQLCTIAVDKISK